MCEVNQLQLQKKQKYKSAQKLLPEGQGVLALG